MLQLLVRHAPSFLRPDYFGADAVYPSTASPPATGTQKVWAWATNYVVPVLFIVLLPVLIVPLAVTFVMACARMHHDEPDPELYGDRPLNGELKLEDEDEDVVTGPVGSPVAPAPAQAPPTYRWN